MHDVPNVFVMDASVHVTNGGFNPVLTIMANTFRAAVAAGEGLEGRRAPRLRGRAMKTPATPPARLRRPRGRSALGTLAGTSWYYGGSDGMGCARCHEIRPLVDAWAHSSHRSVGCKECHGSSFSAELRMHAKNLQRVWLHSRGETPEQIHVRHQDVQPLVERCGSCHRQEYADWQSGPHGAPYAAIFINPEHNANQQLMDDCLRCHGSTSRAASRPRAAARPQGARGRS